ncbi:MAG: hypothetical protein AVDCRST_MAG10-795, partial [uncultured Acidimicrobiales bacterium]
DVRRPVRSGHGTGAAFFGCQALGVLDRSHAPWCVGAGRPGRHLELRVQGGCGQVPEDL